MVAWRVDREVDLWVASEVGLKVGLTVFYLADLMDDWMGNVQVGHWEHVWVGMMVASKDS
jgi:hypothetical protein